jgi:hypothetical protein
VIEVDGFKAWKLDDSQEYSPTIALTPDVVRRYETLELEITLNYKALQPLNKDKVILVFSAEKDGKNIRYEAVGLIDSGADWKQLKLNVKMPANILTTKSNMLSYVWNMDRKQVLIKSMTVNVKSY